MTLSKAVEYQSRSQYSQMGLGGEMDWSNRPEPYKSYPETHTLELPRRLNLPKVEAASVLRGEVGRQPQPLDQEQLARLLFMAYSFTAQVDYGAEVFYYRSVPSAGALYPQELYVGLRGLDGLEDGLYHYALQDFGLTRLCPDPGTLPAPCLVMTARFFRSVWKYRDRAFRYCLLDVGHLAESLSLVAPALGIAFELDDDFDDLAVTDALGLDPSLEAPLSLLRLKADAPAPVGRGSAGRPPEAAPVASRETPSEVVVDAVRLTAAPLEGTPVLAPPDDESAKALPSPDWESFQGPTLVEVLRQRRSRRNFKPRTIRPQDLARMLDMIVGPEVDHWVRVGLVVSEVQDVPDGFYWYRPGEPNRLALQKGGFIGPYLAQAALNQDWVGRANVILVLASDFEDLQSQVGPRALRSAYLAAGRIGQRAYMAAETLGWGCCGIGAFFDEDVARILDLPPETSPMYLLPLGPVKKRTHGGRATG